jgi:peroxiredoxin
MGEDGGPQPITTDELFKGKLVALFGLPGAFTPTCSNVHLPGYVQHADALREKGAEDIICLSVNDAFVMAAWGKDQSVGDRVRMVADGSGAFAAATGLELDLVEGGLGMRCQRFSMIVDNGVVKDIETEGPPVAELTGAEKMLEKIAGG